MSMRLNSWVVEVHSGKKKFTIREVYGYITAPMAEQDAKRFGLNWNILQRELLTPQANALKKIRAIVTKKKLSIDIKIKGEDDAQYQKIADLLYDFENAIGTAIRKSAPSSMLI